MICSVIQSIGNNAYDKNEQFLILFGEEATPEMKNSSIIQSFMKSSAHLMLKPGDQIMFGDQTYEITACGHQTNDYLSNIGHTVLYFMDPKDLPEHASANSLALTPYQLPHLEVGMRICYKFQGRDLDEN